MRIVLAIILLVVILLSGCIKITPKDGSQPKADQPPSAPATQKELPTLPGIDSGKQGNIQGIQPNQPGGFSSIQPNQPGMGSLPGIQPDQPGMGGLPGGQPGVGNLPGMKVPGLELPYGDAYLSADKKHAYPGEAVLLLFDSPNATSIKISDDLGRVYSIDRRRKGVFVYPSEIRTYTYTMTATYSAGSLTRSVQVVVDPFNYSAKYDNGLLAPQLTTFWIEPSTRIKPGESAWLFWNTHDTDFVYIWDSLTGTNWDTTKEGTEERYRENLFGARELTPPVTVKFIVTYWNKNTNNSRGWADAGVSVEKK